MGYYTDHIIRVYNKTPFSIEQQQYITNYVIEILKSSQETDLYNKDFYYLSYVDITFNETKDIYNLYICAKYTGSSEVLFFLNEIKTINSDYKKISYYSGYEGTLNDERRSFDNDNNDNNNNDDASNVIDVCLSCRYIWCHKYNVCSSECLKKNEYPIKEFFNYLNTNNYLFKQLTNLIQKILQKPIVKKIKFPEM